MPIRASLTLRWARAAVLGAVAFAAGAGAHVSAGGLVPGPTGLGILLMACTAGAALFLGNQASAARLSVLVVAGQGFVHTGLAALAGHRGDAPHVGVTMHPTTASVPRTGSYYDQWAAANPAAAGAEAGPALPAWLVHSVADLAQQPVMALAHVLAAITIGLWLAVGERALWAVLLLTAAWTVRLVARLRAALVAGLVPVAPRLPALPRAASTGARRPRRTIWSRGPVRRGPPILLTAH